MYYSHFGLNQAPFKITPNTEFFFGGGKRGPILEALIYAIAHGEGVIKVTGEVGSGKTMLCHMLQARLPEHIETVYIANPSVSPEEILRAMAFELQLGPAREASRLEVMQALHDHLLERHAGGRRVVAFVEESQSMPPATLEAIRLLSNLETRNDKLLQIVLFGQPELDDILRQPALRPLRERITHSFALEPLTAGEIREYLRFRMRAAGYRGPDLFPPAVVKRIARASEGLTRRVNLIADKTLLAAFSENTHTIRPRHVAAAVRDSEFSQRPRAAGAARFGWGAALIAGGLAAGAGLYALLQHPASGPLAVAVVEPPVAGGTLGTRATPAPDFPTPWQAGAAAAPAEGKTAAVEGRAAAPVTAAVAPAAERADTPAPKDAAAATPLPHESEAVPPPSDLLDARMAATREWLATQPDERLSIQLLGSDNEPLLREHLKVLAKLIEMNKVFVYRTVARQKPSLTVLYGSFSDPRLARQTLDALPESLRVNRPFLRTVEGIRGEIRRYEMSAGTGDKRS